MDIKKNLTNIVVIIGLIGSIGAGFTKYGELTTRLDAVSNQTAPDLSKIEENIQTNSLGVSDNVTEIVKVNSELKQDINKVNSELKQDINVVDQNAKREIEILKKTIKLLELQIQEIDTKNSNPLG